MRPEDYLVPSLADDFPNIPIERAEGPYAFDPSGKKYLDFIGGMAACNIGHCHPRVVEAIERQARVLIHGPAGVMFYKGLSELSEELVRILPAGIDRFFYGNSGSEAIEGGVKLARYVTERPNVVAFLGGFHGRTFGSVALTASKAKYKRHYDPLPAGIYHSPYPHVYRNRYSDDPEQVSRACLGALDDLFTHVAEPSSVAAILVEPVQGEGGYVVPPVSFLRGLRERCDRHGILLIYDEIQTGFGRTGSMFAAQTFGVVPDIFSLAKGIASGLPLSVVATTRELSDRWSAGSHGTTFGGNPVACAAAVATLQVIQEEDLCKRARDMGSRLMKGLHDLAGRHDAVGDVRGVGLMAGMEFVRSRETREPAPEQLQSLLQGALEKGLFLYPAGVHDNVVRFIPPLNIDESHVDFALSVIDEVLSAG
ncbi:MAG: aminotransferase class III-fold pyridoxal phosphate-dependent enzyme [Thermaerobacterales bacterium]